MVALVKDGDDTRLEGPLSSSASLRDPYKQPIFVSYAYSAFDLSVNE